MMSDVCDSHCAPPSTPRSRRMTRITSSESSGREVLGGADTESVSHSDTITEPGWEFLVSGCSPCKLGSPLASTSLLLSTCLVFKGRGHNWRDVCFMVTHLTHLLTAPFCWLFSFVAIYIFVFIGVLSSPSNLCSCDQPLIHFHGSCIMLIRDPSELYHVNQRPISDNTKFGSGKA